MLELLLLRHGKSRWSDPDVADHDRDLAPRGVKAAQVMGELLRDQALLPDLVLCSTARRAGRTWDLSAAALGAMPRIEYDQRLYLAAPDRMIAVARERGGAARRLLMVGHDPGMHQLAKRLAAAGDEGLRATLAVKFPTAGLARLAIDLSAWSEFERQTGTLLGFWWPRELGVAGD